MNRRRGRRVRGAGGKSGGGGSVRSPVEASDSLQSQQFARVLDLLSEGEIGGLVNGYQSVYLDDTPLQNPDGTFNFTGVTISGVAGTQLQSYLPGFQSVETEVPVGSEVTAAVPITQTITNSNANRARVTISVPQLTQQDSTTGDLTESSVTVRIALQANGGGFVNLFDVVIAGKTTARYQRHHEIDLTASGPAPWDIRLTRITADSLSVLLQNKTVWDSYTEIIDAKLSYPNSALIGTEIDASQFNTIPRRAFDVRGIIVAIPSNYNPVTRAYTGIWDGVFTGGVTDNPAWCFYAMLTNERWGLGKFIAASQVDKWSLYAIGQYCDELVDDGFGGTEPRFTCNLYLQTRAEAFRVIANMASIFRGMAYWGAGSVVPVADMPSDAVALFTMANVLDGKFSYQGSARNARHTVALISWNDPDDAYRQKIEYVEDESGIDRYGIVQTEVLAFGCTSRGQAHRLGKWLLYSERVETEIVTFGVGLDGVLVSPGNVIKTQDAARAGKRFGGRVVSATTGAVTIDSPVTIESGKTYTISVIAPGGTVVAAPVTNAPGAASVLACSPALTQAPQVNAIWVLAASDLVPETWRVLAATEAEKGKLQIVALKHDPAKYDAVELDILFESPPTSSITATPAGVTNLTATESLFLLTPGTVSNRVTLSWTGTTGRYRVSYRGLMSNIVSLPETTNPTIDIDGLTPGRYTFNVTQVNALGRVSPVNSLLQDIAGKTAPPADIVDFTVIKSTGFALAQWALPVDLDVTNGGYIVIRHSPLTTGAAWENGIGLQDFPGRIVQGLVPLISGTYMAKAFDSSGNFSTNTASFVLTEGMITGFTTVGTTTQHPTFAGAKTNVAVVGTDLQLDGTTLIDDMLDNIDDWLIGDLSGISPSGSYDFDAALDLGTVATRRFEADISAVSFDTDDTIDVRDALIDDWDEFDGDVINDCDVTLYASITDNNPVGSPTAAWGPYQPFMVADFTCRAARFRLDFVSGQSTHNIAVSQLVVHAKIPA